MKKYSSKSVLRWKDEHRPAKGHPEDLVSENTQSENILQNFSKWIS
jgi:hypothetical protein